MSLTAVWNSNLKYPVRDCCTGTPVIVAVYLLLLAVVLVLVLFTEYSQNGNAFNQRSNAEVVNTGGHGEGVEFLFQLLREFTSRRFAPLVRGSFLHLLYLW
jgi:hypothetical protein